MAISSGSLISGIDTKSLISQLVAVESRPILLLTQRRLTFQNQLDAFKDLNTRISALESKAYDLTLSSSVLNKKATSSSTDSLVTTANASAVNGSYEVEVVKLASATKLQTGTAVGQGNDNGGLAALNLAGTDTVSNLNTNNKLKEALNEGTFFVNGQQILVTNSSTLNSIMSDISTATSGAVTAAINNSSAKGGQVLTLSSGSAVTVSSGTSNFLSVFKLDTASYSAGDLESTDAVNGLKTNIKLDGSDGATNLAQSVGSGTLTLNGTSITYNQASDTLDDIITRINNSDSGVRASLSSLGSSKVILTNKNLGPQSISFSDTGNLADTLGFGGTGSQVLGEAAQVRIDGGATQYFNKNTGIQADGLAGVTLDLKVKNPGDAYTVTISDDTASAISKVQGFVDQFNNIVGRINELTAYNPTTKVKGLLLSDSTVSTVRSTLFNMVFKTITGLSEGASTGTLAELGVSTGAIGSEPGTTNKLEFDSSKLTSAIASSPTRVAQILGITDPADGSKGIMSQFKTYLDGLSTVAGTFDQKQKAVNQQITSIDDRIEALNKRLDAKQRLLERDFSGMDKVLVRLQSQQAALNSLLLQTTQR